MNWNLSYAFRKVIMFSLSLYFVLFSQNIIYGKYMHEIK